jgi:thiol-disulfide isomerase/thioredoxin
MAENQPPAGQPHATTNRGPEGVTTRPGEAAARAATQAVTNAPKETKLAWGNKSVEPMQQRLLWGTAAGVAVGAAVWLGYALLADRAVFSPAYAAGFLLGAASLCAVLRAAAGRSLGSAVGLVLGFVLGVAIGQPSTPAIDPRLVGEGDFTGAALDGRKIDVKDLRGKVVLVDFWATWCQPCVASLPHLKALHEELHGQGLEIVGVSLDHDRGSLESFVAKRRLPWPQVYLREQQDPSLEALTKRIALTSIPRVMLIDREGRVASASVPGDEIDSSVRQLLARRPVEAPRSPPAVPPAAWFFALGGAIAATLFQRSAEAGAAAGGGRS